MGVPSPVTTELPCLGDFSAAFVEKKTLRYLGFLQSRLLSKAELFLRQGKTLAKMAGGSVLIPSRIKLAGLHQWLSYRENRDTEQEYSWPCAAFCV